MKRPRTLKPEEFEDLFDLQNRAFNLEALGYNLDLARAAPADDELRNHLVIEEDGKIVSNVSVYPCPVLIRGVRLEVGYIGGVATELEYRGRGFMSSLLEYSLEKMTREGYDLSTLGGDRDRYGRFGWEVAGQQCFYTIGSKSIRTVEDTAPVEFRPYTGEESDLRTIVQLHDAEPIRTPRSQQKYRLMFNNLQKKTMQVWLAEVPGLGSSYSVFERQNENAAAVIEFGGNPEVFKRFLRRFMEKEKLERITVSAPALYTPFTPVLTEISGGYQIRPFKMMRIMDLGGYMEKMSPLIEERLKTVGLKAFTLSLEVSETGQGVTLEFDEDLRVDRKSGKNKVVLDQRSMVRLLFGPGKASRTFGFEGKTGLLLDVLFPLDFYVWQLDRH